MHAVKKTHEVNEMSAQAKNAKHESIRDSIRKLLFNSSDFLTIDQILDKLKLGDDDKMRIRNNMWNMKKEGELKMSPDKGYKMTKKGEAIVRNHGLLLVRDGQPAKGFEIPGKGKAPVAVPKNHKTVVAEIAPAPKPLHNVLGVISKIQEMNRQQIADIDAAIAALEAMKKQLKGE